MQRQNCDPPTGKGLIPADAESSKGKDEDFLIDREIAHLTKLRSEPSESARKGSVGTKRHCPIPAFKMLAGREANWSGRGSFSAADRSHVLGRCLPVNGPWPVDAMDSRAYVSQFCADGSVFIAGFQESTIRVYDVENGWKVKKDIMAKSLQWTITDTSLSPDQRFLVYASMSPIIHIVNVETAAKESHANITDIHDGLDFSVHDEEDYGCGIFSIQFSTDGRELVAGSNNDSIYVYDLESNQLTSRVPAHDSDVNTVTFADESGHLIFSGSDDSFCKVWDRRSSFTKGKPEGVLSGHLEGITFIDSRRDGRYFISNSKDQTTKLWDIRKMSSEPNYFRRRPRNWDYRWMDYPPKARHLKHPSDQSLATYRGHSVLCTLIRCYFSPSYSTGQRYIYTGSNDKSVYIYDVLTGAQVARLEAHGSTVRDCSWHPFYPMLVSSSWDCRVLRWEFSGNSADAMAIKKKRPRRRKD